MCHQAKFEAKEKYHGGPKLKKSKEVQDAKKKALKRAEKSLAWFAGDDETKEVSKKVARYEGTMCCFSLSHGRVSVSSCSSTCLSPRSSTQIRRR